MAGKRGRIRAGLWLAILGLGLGTGLGDWDSVHAGHEARPGPALSPGEPVAVPVVDGRAEFRMRRLGGGPLLIVASSLAREGGPFAMSIQAEAAAVAGPPLPSWIPPRFVSPSDSDLEPVGEAESGGPPGTASGALPPASRVFWLPIRPGEPADASRYVPIRASRVQVGRHVQVYVDARDVERVDPALPALVVTTFDGEVWPRSAARWGTARDVDGDGRFTVLLTSWLGRLPRRDEPVEGCFRGADFDPALGPPFGNRCDMVALDANLSADPHAQTVLIHEYAHAVLFTRRVLGVPGVVRASEDEAGWLDEAIAHLVEDDHARSFSNLDRRLAAYQAAPEAFRLVSEDPGDVGFAAGGGHRGAATLFLRWCALGTGRDVLLRRLAQPGARGIANLERATGVPFPALFRGWSVSQFLAPETMGGARPAASIVTVGGPAQRWLAQPTTVRYAIVTPGAAPVVGIRVEAPPEAGLQVTAVPLGMVADDLGAGAVTGRNGVDTAERPEHSSRPVDPRAQSSGE